MKHKEEPGVIVYWEDAVLETSITVSRFIAKKTTLSKTRGVLVHHDENHHYIMVNDEREKHDDEYEGDMYKIPTPLVRKVTKTRSRSKNQ